MLHPISETGKSKKIFLRISKGAIISKRNGEVTSFEAISGSLKGIELKEHEFENKKFRNWHILLSDTESGEDYDISVSRDSGVFKSIVRSLVTEQGLENLNDVKIEVYTSKTGFTNAVVSAEDRNSTGLTSRCRLSAMSLSARTKLRTIPPR